MRELNPIPKKLLCTELIKMFLHADIHKTPVNMVYLMRHVRGTWELVFVQVTDVNITQRLPTEKIPTSSTSSGFVYSHVLQLPEIDYSGNVVMKTTNFLNISEDLADYGDSWGLRFVV